MAAKHRTTAHKSNIKSTGSRIRSFRTSIVAFGAAFAGVIIALPVSLAIVLPMVRSEIAADTAGLRGKTLQARTAADDLSCSQATPQTAVAPMSSSGHVLGASTGHSSSSGGQSSGGGSITKTVFVHKLVNGVFTTTGTISNTGPNSENVIDTTNVAKTTVTNNNDISVESSNSQTATSGTATTTQNTTAGSTTSGDATNTNSSNVGITVNN